MRLLLPLLALAVAAVAPAAMVRAQSGYYYPPPGAWGGGYHASTYEEGVQRGFADIVRAAGETNLRNSEAAINYEQARSAYLDNRLKYTETYFENRRLNREYREAERGPRVTSEQLFQIARDRAPTRLSPSEVDPLTGYIAWPVLLRDEPYTDYRRELETLFEQRAHQGQTGTGNFRRIQEVAGAMQDELRARLRDYPSGEYMRARRFIEGLAFEAGFSS